MSFPEGVHAFTQTVWGSIGFATGSAVGAFTAALEQSEKFKRPILITGEGSMQMTIQALGDMLRFNLAPIMSVLQAFFFSLFLYAANLEQLRAEQ